MKAILRKSVIASFLTLALVTSAQANWFCTMHNAKGQTWNGTGPTRAIAASNAMKFCSRNSKYASNCVLDYCRQQ